jgi:hypothetical protein
MVYYAVFHSVMSYGLIFGGNSTNCVFKLQKRAIRIIKGLGILTYVEVFLNFLKYYPLCPIHIYIYIFSGNVCS